MRHNNVVSGHSKSTGFPRVNGLSNGPRDLGRHNLVSELRLTITYELGWGYPPVFSDIGLS